MTDGDSNDRAGYGRGTVSGVTDSDANDRSGNGRGSGVTDNDANDRAGYGRGRSYSSVSVCFVLIDVSLHY